MGSEWFSVQMVKTTKIPAFLKPKPTKEQIITSQKNWTTFQNM